MGIMGRRADHRAATTAEIKNAALDQIAAQGAPALSMRAVARDIEMSPAGLYRYFDGRDALLTELLADAYNDLARAVEDAIAAAGPSPRKRLIAGAEGYRQWAVEDPNRFMLIFGTPIPGYHAPEDGPTVAAMRRVGMAFFGVAAYAFVLDAITFPSLDRDPTPEERATADEVARLAPGFPVDAIGVLIGAWARWHGLVNLEVLGQLAWLYPDAAAFFRSEVERIADELGATD
jgi:AcrR family transcriptional regulator